MDPQGTCWLFTDKKGENKDAYHNSTPGLGRDRMCEKFRQLFDGGFLRVLRFPPPEN